MSLSVKKTPDTDHISKEPRNKSDNTINSEDNNAKSIQMGKTIIDQQTYTRSLIEASLDPFVVIGLDGKTTDVNHATELVTGLIRDELIGNDFSNCFTEPAKVIEGYKLVFGNGTIRDYALDIRHKNGKITSVMYNASVYRDKTGQVVGLFAVARDITERKHAEEELKRHRDHLDDLVKVRTEELSNSVKQVIREAKERENAEKAVQEINARYRLLVENSKLGINFLDTEGIFLYLNKPAARIWGKSPNDMINKNIRDLFPPEMVDDFFNIIQKVCISKTGFEYERFIEQSNKYLIENIQPVIDDNQNILGVQVTTTDITVRKQAEETLRVSERRYHELLESLTEGIGIVDENEDIQFCNPSFAFIFDLDSPDNLLGKNLIDFVPKNQRKLVLNQTAQRKNNTSSRYELEIITKKNKKKFISASVSPRFNDKGNYVGAFGCVTNITVQKEMKDALVESNKQLMFERKALEEKNIALKEVLSQIEDDKKNIASRIQSNIDRVISPILRRLNEKVGPAEKNDISLLQSSLEQVTTPFVSKLESLYGKLTPREVEICGMIKNGLSSKEIALLLNTSLNTVRNQRQLIRKKLDISGQKTNLTLTLRKT